MMLLLLACTNQNTEPAWQAVNGTDVRRFLGIPFLASPIVGSPGDEMTIAFDVKDRERDAVEILIPKAPPGMTVDGMKANWSVPLDFWDSFELEIIAMDEHGAFEVVYVPFEIQGATWQDDTGGLGAGTFLYGLADVSSGFDGELALIVETDEASCVWYWPTTTLVATVEDCSECDRAWEVSASGGVAVEGACEDVPMAEETFPATKIGFAESYSFRGFELTNVVLVEVDGYGWAPLGEGTLQADTFEFIVPLDGADQ